MEVYFFGLLDENMKSILPGNFERHWGIFAYDGQPKFPMDLTGKGNDKMLIAAEGVEYMPKQWCILDPEAKAVEKEISRDVDYACKLADCTPLQAGGSCSNIEPNHLISYAFNIYFQMQDQDVRACDFRGLGKIVTNNVSISGCRFPIAIVSAGEKVGLSIGSVAVVLIGAIMALVQI